MSGLRVEQDGAVVEVPREIESAGGAVLDAYVAHAFAALAAPPAPAAPQE